MRPALVLAAIGAVGLGLGLAGPGCGSGRKTAEVAPRPAIAPARAAAPAAAPPATSEPLLTRLSIVTRARPPAADELAAWSRRIDRGEATVEAYIDELLASPAFAGTVAPEMILGEALVGWPFHVVRFSFVLRTTPESEGPPIYYVTKPCARKAAVPVHPWWDLHGEVLVCPDAYRPNVWRTRASKDVEHTCDAFDASPRFGDSGCGCGPNLIRCLRGQADHDARTASAHAELRDTVRHVIEQDLPYAALFSGRSTFHDRNMELTYRSWRIEAEQRSDGSLLADLDGWPAEGQWAERFESAPGEHAGLLTAPGLLHYFPDRRQRQWFLFERLWCTGASSNGATVHNVLDLGVASFQGGKNEGWQRLASQPICTDCHARTDYGFQFFWAFPDPKPSAGHFVPAIARNGLRGMLYGNDIQDPRGEAELTPAGFAELALRQPEFGRCMSRNVAEHVLGIDASADDAAALAAGFDAGRTTVKQLVKQALLRWVTRVQAGEPAEVLPAAPSWSGTGPVPLSPELERAIDGTCSGCHFDGAVGVPSFEGHALPRDRLLHMLAEVSATRMPKDRALSAAERMSLIDALIVHLWRTPADQREAHHQLGAPLRAPGVWRWSLAEHLIRRAAGAPETSDRAWNAFEAATRADQATYTPGFAAMTVVEAIQACKDAGKTGQALEDCVRAASVPRLFLRDR
jgi:hypothetical protein